MILDYLSNEHTSRPIWFMRQAGRYLPEYRKLRSSCSSFLDMCYNPNIAAEISMQPIKRFGFDCIILFSDILVVPHAMGIKVDFLENVGPILCPVNFEDNTQFASNKTFLNHLSPVFETISLLKKRKKKETLIGFCGSPFTVLTYMIEGKTSKDHFKTKVSLIKHKNKVKDLLKILTDFSIIYLEGQIQAGAEVIQLFESWAGVPNKSQYDEMIIQPNQKIVQYLKKKYPRVKIICFTKGNGKNLYTFLKNVSCDVISVQDIEDERVIDYCYEKKIAVQGNLDPVDLYVGGDHLEKKIKQIMKKFNGLKHIFNLSHGINPCTPLENVYKTVNIVRGKNDTK